MKRIEELDKNFAWGGIGRSDLRWIDVAEDDSEVEVYGTPGCKRIWTRIEAERIGEFAENIQNLGVMTSGVRLKFRTNSNYVAIKAILGSKNRMPHMPDTGISGFDLYCRGEGMREYKYCKTFNPDLALDVEDREPVTVGECLLWTREWRDIVINFPLYNGVEEVMIGIEEGAELASPTPYIHEKPILFYGSSITQGGCASRPGNSYPALVSRWLDSDFINLGFSGGAKGEQEMARYIGEKDVSVVVVDYDHNAPSLEHLKETHEAFYQTVREMKPGVPIVLISKPDFDGDPVGNGQRRAVIKKTYDHAKAMGDEAVYFIDGQTLFGEERRDSCTVDGCHPNDLGFMRMAEVIYPVLSQILHSGAYTIPYIDLDKREDLQVVVDREVGLYLGHPTTTMLADQKTIYTVYPKGHGTGEIVLKKSEDAGKTWSDRLQVPKSWADSKETPILYQMERPDGGVRILLTSGIPTEAGGFKLAYSDDAGETWSEFKTYYDERQIMGVVAFASLIRLKQEDGEWDNKWMGLFHDHAYRNYRVFLSFGEDGELVVSPPETYIKHREIEAMAGLCEPCALRSPDGKEIAILFRGNHKVTSSMVIVSYDEGRTFSKPKEVAGALRGERHQAKYDVISGKLLVTFRSYGIRQNPDDRHWVAWVGSYEDLVRGRQGECRMCLKKNIGTVSWNGNDGDCGYAGIEQIVDSKSNEYGTYILTSYGHWDADEVNHEPYIMAVRFKLEEILASK
ncbi:MAG: SGNH/GDSL hydrolase family protein [Cellulosilyticaceae bacterium]